MIGLPSIANPWVILGLLGALIGVGTLGYTQGHSSGEQDVQVRWDAREKALDEASKESTRLVQAASDKLQGERDEERKRTAEKVAALDADVAGLTDRLRSRPARPSGPASPSSTACPGPDSGTGLGLYREDGLFLVGEAATAKRIKLQRDECYVAYDLAKKTIEQLTSTTPP